jgi:hypothetical protein
MKKFVLTVMVCSLFCVSFSQIIFAWYEDDLPWYEDGDL